MIVAVMLLLLVPLCTDGAVLLVSVHRCDTSVVLRTAQLKMV